MGDTEIYVLCRHRSNAVAELFLDTFGKSRTEAAVDYPYPEYEDEPIVIYDSPSELLERLETDRGSSYSLYWNCHSMSEPDQVMLFFTSEGRLIVGVGGPRSSYEHDLRAMAELVDGEFGYVTGGSRPPDSVDEFAQIAIASTLPSVIDGRFRAGQW